MHLTETRVLYHFLPAIAISFNISMSNLAAVICYICMWDVSSHTDTPVRSFYNVMGTSKILTNASKLISCSIFAVYAVI